MVKSKQRQLATKHANKKNAQGGNLDSSNPNIELDLLGEDGWVVVKKQRVTILIPPLPVSTKSKITNQGPGQLEAMPRKEVEDQSRLSVQTCSKLPSGNGQEKRPRSMHCRNVPIAGSMLLNRRLRVSNLERKLQQAGGLSRWLTSIGLGQFVRIFQAKSVNKFQLVNLNMQKLKDMGADAVGPRRKLIHAIDCVCQPFCFEAI
ncbi:Sterile alpha motif domain - like 7 [Theobroma cacao]|nr:Sterile alpha motif domain - like 7 [Theobroma cacao]